MCEHPLAARYEYCWDSMVSNLWPQKSDRRLLKLNLSLKPKGTVPRLSKIGLEKNTQFLEEKGEKNVRTRLQPARPWPPSQVLWTVWISNSKQTVWQSLQKLRTELPHEL